ncbi:hypothetical protein [Kordiimonas sp. SCSIO 12610]|uniref:hypothetical protein n=1 Tax=Kordiimonas sp. SCSIO 12610 TaxID=2829597 RepID=UPI0021087267|nr:hypothetical protein [Kordiimonas sp. SCSIO 12610]UTW54378.1 hypothetical protein KFF44_11190 [Kordiimonas sp. SCSIO 12610]
MKLWLILLCSGMACLNIQQPVYAAEFTPPTNLQNTEQAINVSGRSYQWHNDVKTAYGDTRQFYFEYTFFPDGQVVRQNWQFQKPNNLTVNPGMVRNIWKQKGDLLIIQSQAGLANRYGGGKQPVWAHSHYKVANDKITLVRLFIHDGKKIWHEYDKFSHTDVTLASPIGPKTVKAYYSRQNSPSRDKDWSPAAYIKHYGAPYQKWIEFRQ